MKKLEIPNIKPKLKIGDAVWIMHENVPTLRHIVIVTLSHSSNYDHDAVTTSICYTLEGGKQLYECTSTMPGNHIYTTKKDLILSFLD